MFDIKFVRKNRELLEKNIAERGIKGLDLSILFALDQKNRGLQAKLDTLQKKKNLLGNAIEKAAFAGINIDEKAAEKIRDLNNVIREQEKEIFTCTKQISESLIALPNIIHPATPKGLPGKPNKFIRKSKISSGLDFKPKTYLEIGRKLNIIETAENFSKLGLNVIFYKGWGGKLQRALINFLMDKHSRKNSYEIFPPVIMEGSPILKMLQGKEFEENSLPQCYFAYSLCFRKDWGFAEDVKKDPQRVTQFDSIELIKITQPDRSDPVLEDTVKETEKILDLLELPYEVYIFTTGNLDHIVHKAYSIKVFLPGSDIFLEISVCSNLIDFFSRDMNIGYRANSASKKNMAHIVTATSLIIPRAMMAILENHQRPDGSIFIPKVLRPYLSGIERI